MELVKVLKYDAASNNEWAIYKLNDEEREKFGRVFAVTIGTHENLISDGNSSERLLIQLCLWRGERLFDTYNEAFMHIKLMEASSKLPNGISWIEELEETHADKLTAMGCYANSSADLSDESDITVSAVENKK